MTATLHPARRRPGADGAATAEAGETSRAGVNIRPRSGSNGFGTMPVLAPALSLVDRCVAGEGQAWRELHQRCQPLVAVFLRRMGVPPADLPDACQEVFLQMFRYLGRFEGRSDLKTWIYKLCLSQAERQRRRRRVAAALRWLLRRDRDGAGGGPDPGWSESETQRRVQAALDALKPIHRSVFVLYELEGLTGEEVAAATGLPFATVRRRLHHARLTFQACIREDREDGGQQPQEPDPTPGEENGS